MRPHETTQRDRTSSHDFPNPDATGILARSLHIEASLVGLTSAITPTASQCTSTCCIIPSQTVPGTTRSYYSTDTLSGTDEVQGVPRRGKRQWMQRHSKTCIVRDRFLSEIDPVCTWNARKYKNHTIRLRNQIDLVLGKT